MLYEPERGEAMQALETASRRVASYKTREASSKSELMIMP